MIGKIIHNDNGVLAISVRFKAEVGELVEVKRKKKARTLDQNALYWLFCDYVGNDLKMTADEIHEGFKEQHLRQFKTINGKTFRTVKSSSELETDAFGEYFEKCIVTASEFGVDCADFFANYERYKK